MTVATEIKLSCSFLLALTMAQKALRMVWPAAKDQLIVEADFFASEVHKIPGCPKGLTTRMILITGKVSSRFAPDLNFECHCEIKSGTKYCWEPHRVEVKLEQYTGVFVFEEDPFLAGELIPVHA